MKNKSLVILAALALGCILAIAAKAQTPFVTNTPPVNTLSVSNLIPGSGPVVSDLNKLLGDLSIEPTNWLLEAHALYAPGLPKRYGGGLGVFYPVNPYLYTGIRADYVDGGFWMPSGNVGIQLPLQLFTWLKLTPFGYAGIGAPLSGAKFGSLTIPGKITDNNGQATAITGVGVALQIYAPKNGAWNVDLIADQEQWSGFHGNQNRFGLLFHKKF